MNFSEQSLLHHALNFALGAVRSLTGMVDEGVRPDSTRAALIVALSEAVNELASKAMGTLDVQPAVPTPEPAAAAADDKPAGDKPAAEVRPAATADQPSGR